VSGECLVLIEGQERRLRAWDFVHCPPFTEHVFVGAGDGPCVFVGVGARNGGEGLVYPVSELALGHQAGVSEEATTGTVAYADAPETTPGSCPEGLLPDR
jgi:oxalate decarboxylase/phosphoglucose isomerase-like protein (cupin superfamily)